MNNNNRKKQGFTLIEVIAVLVVLGILAAVALPRYVDLQENARLRAIDAGIAELNGRESLEWANVLLSNDGYSDDDDVHPINTALGDDYTVDVTSNTSGTITFTGGTAITLTRSVSTSTQPGFWTRND